MVLMQIDGKQTKNECFNSSNKLISFSYVQCIDCNTILMN